MEAAVLLTAKLACHMNAWQAEYTSVKIKSFLVLLGTLLQYAELSMCVCFIYRRSQQAAKKGVNSEHVSYFSLFLYSNTSCNTQHEAAFKMQQPISHGDA